MKSLNKKRRQALIQNDEESMETLRSWLLEAADAALSFLQENGLEAAMSSGLHADSRGPPVDSEHEAEEEAQEP